MKKYINISYLLASLFVLLTACSEEIFSPNTLGDNVTLSLSYSDVSPKEITVNTRAGEENEKRLDNLYIYIFDGEGKLKGFKAITSGLDNNTSNSRHATINNILTKAGDSYIYAVANINTALYPVETSNGTIVDGKLPIGLDEEKAQAGEYKDFTKDMLLELPFERKSNTIDINDAYLMSGAVNEGQAVTITETGIANEKNVIRLSRIVSKVKFTIKAGTGKSFKLNTYDIRNVASNGTLVGTIDNNTRTECTNVSDITGLTTRPNEIENGAQYFEVYAPENLQTRKGSASNQAEREDDKQSTPKQFVNAPEYGTYVVLKGQYEETKSDGNRITANVVYYVHLGDIQSDLNNYDVERNCKYTYNITVAGVNNIIVEAKKEEGQNPQPGAEGLVLEYGTTNKTLTLDSHYDYMVMRFYQSDIKQLKHDDHNPNLGYYYQVYALGKHTGAINVGETTTENGNPDNVDTSWIEFAIKCSRDNSTSKYSSANDGRGEPCSYPGTKYKSDLYSIEKFLKLLYDKADDDSFWSGTDASKGRYIDATCFISENYYKDLSWDQYVNDVDQRAFYVANTVYTSYDGRSVYATTQYGLHQYNIQTFYDRSQAGSVIAYGCETINDEAGKNFTALGNGTRSKTSGTDEWNGRTNMLLDINSDIDEKNYNWDKAKSNTSLVRACLSRNRDLNGDGKISNDEIRWYAPTQAQYAGLWIGEEIMSSEAKLYNKNTSELDCVNNSNEPKAGSRMLYYAADKAKNTFFSEEGMADANNNATYPAAYVRCLRNLESYDTNDKGYAKEPDTYYSYDSSKRLIKLDKVDDQALNITGGQSELQSHTERSSTNKPAKAFYFAKENYGSPTQQQVVEGTFKCYGNYDENGTSWRVPNQREFTMMVLTNSNNVTKTYCRTKFSNEKFRYSWTYNGNFTMDVSMKTTAGSVRCIKAVKE